MNGIQSSNYWVREISYFNANCAQAFLGTQKVKIHTSANLYNNNKCEASSTSCEMTPVSCETDPVSCDTSPASCDVSCASCSCE